MHVSAAREFELQSLDALARAPIGARDPAAFEAPIDDGSLLACGEHGANCLAQFNVAAGARIRAQIEHGQFAIEQARDDRPNGMGVEQRDALMVLAEAMDDMVCSVQ